MADIKESGMTKATDGAYIRALDSNGNSILISKADMVELMRANIPLAANGAKGLADYSLLPIYKGDIDDCNNVTTHGIYRCLKTSANMPIAIGVAAVLISFRCYGDSSYVFQLWFDLSAASLYWRRKTDEYWLSWAKIS